MLFVANVPYFYAEGKRSKEYSKLADLDEVYLLKQVTLIEKGQHSEKAKMFL